MTFFTIILFGACLTCGLFYAALIIGLEEAENPNQFRRKEMSNYEKHHVHRTDVVLPAERAKGNQAKTRLNR